eukprot:SM000073S21473  [mRNA]  locus=s73:558369:559541:+ [translate_table: standard]
MALYGALETGAVELPLQVYNRERSHLGFILSCYDAFVRYDRATDTFSARYPPHGKREPVHEASVPRAHVRTAPTETSAHELFRPEPGQELRPGDHVEVQWRRSKSFPFGWWYGVVGHARHCDGSPCLCHKDGTVWLEFRHYREESRWRRAAVSRTVAAEVPDAPTDGFYGGMRVLRDPLEVAAWQAMWPQGELLA